MEATAQAHTKKEQDSGCKFCRLLNDGICGSYCLMTKEQKQEIVSKYRHLIIKTR